MQSTHWERIKALFEEALALPVLERAAFVAAIEEETVRTEVEALLAAHEQAEAAHALEG